MFIFVKSRIEDFNVFLPHFCKLSNLTCVFIRYVHVLEKGKIVTENSAFHAQ